MVHHVALETRRSEAEPALRFWRILGFEPVDPPESLRDRAAWVEREGTQIHILWADEPAVPPQGHVAVVLHDYDAQVAALREAGFEFETRTQHWGAPRGFAQAPGGHRVEVMAAPPRG